MFSCHALLETVAPKFEGQLPSPAYEMNHLFLGMAPPSRVLQPSYTNIYRTALCSNVIAQYSL